MVIQGMNNKREMDQLSKWDRLMAAVQQSEPNDNLIN